jgi:hypothetical protein
MRGGARVRSFSQSACSHNFSSLLGPSIASVPACVTSSVAFHLSACVSLTGPAPSVRSRPLVSSAVCKATQAKKSMYSTSPRSLVPFESHERTAYRLAFRSTSFIAHKPTLSIPGNQKVVIVGGNAGIVGKSNSFTGLSVTPNFALATTTRGTGGSTSPLPPPPPPVCLLQGEQARCARRRRRGTD